MRARLLITRHMPEPVLAAARENFDVTHRDEPGPMDHAQAVTALETYDAIMPTLGDAFDAAAFDAARNSCCKILANFGVGTNHIDLDAATAAGVVVCNTPGAVTEATADIAVMLMLMAARRASQGEALLRSGNWAGWHPSQLLGLHVSGKTLGVIGMGRIGKAIARRCRHGFGMDVVFHNRSRVTDPELDASQLNSAQDVAARADVLVVAVPGGAATHHLINAEIFNAMPAHAVIVNISRGDVIDETALIAALQTGQIAGAGLDVYENEPDVPLALIALPNVSLLPHMGTAALEVRLAMGLMAVDNLNAFAAGKTCPNQL